MDGVRLLIGSTSRPREPTARALAKESTESKRPPRSIAKMPFIRRDESGAKFPRSMDQQFMPSLYTTRSLHGENVQGV